MAVNASTLIKNDLYMPSSLVGSGGYFLRVKVGEDGYELYDSSDFTTLLGLENVDNTADVDKPISTATQNYIDDLVADPVNKLQNVVGTSGTLTLDTSLYDTFVITCTAPVTIVLDNMADGRTVSLVINNGDAGVTYPTEVKWPEGEVPVLTTGSDRIVMQQISSTIIHSSLAGQAYA